MSCQLSLEWVLVDPKVTSHGSPGLGFGHIDTLKSERSVGRTVCLFQDMVDGTQFSLKLYVQQLCNFQNVCEITETW